MCSQTSFTRRGITRSRAIALLTGFGLLAGLQLVGVPAASAGAATALSARGSDSCVVTPGGGVLCWGYNVYGQLGDGSTLDRNVPVPVVGMDQGVASVSVGTDHTCAVTDRGGVKCWGDNHYGQLGDGTTVDRVTPVRVIGLDHPAVSVSSGNMSTCAVLSTGRAKCWGRNEEGQLGDGTTVNRPTPVAIRGLGTGVASVTSGLFFSCALSQSGVASCWGDNRHGALGDGTTQSRPIPAPVLSLAQPVKSIVAGGWYTCAVTAVGEAWCWGENTEGQLGNGTSDQQPLPSKVVGLTDAVEQVVPGSSHTCAVTDVGGAWCWGSDYQGMLGAGTSLYQQWTPVRVWGLDAGVVAMALGDDHTCALTVTGALRCWGSDSWGALGNGIGWSRPVPTAVLGLAGRYTGQYRPEAEVAPIDGPYRGSGIFNNDGTDQTIKTVIVPGEHKEFLIRFTNSGSIDDTVFLQPWETGGTLKFRWRFFVDAGDVTGPLNGGAYWTELTPGESVVIRARIYKRLSAPVDKQAGLWFGIYSMNNSAKQDVVRVRVVAGP